MSVSVSEKHTLVLPNFDFYSRIFVGQVTYVKFLYLATAWHFLSCVIYSTFRGATSFTASLTLFLNPHLKRANNYQSVDRRYFLRRTSQFVEFDYAQNN